MAAITTIPENDRRERYVATGGQTEFPFDFPVYQPEHVAAFRLRGTAEVELAYGADFEVTGAGDQDGGTVTLLDPAEAGDVITLKSAQPTARTTSYGDGGDLKAAALNAEGNRIYIEFQELQDALSRTLRLAETDPPSAQQLPPAPARANGVLGFDGSGNLTILYPDLTGEIDAAYAQLLITNALNQVIPPGTIVQWAGSIGSIPATWALCDGTNGTPDLRDKFIVAAGPTKPANTTGGNNTVATSAAGGHDHGGQTQEHALTEAQMPPHAHNYLLSGVGGTVYAAGGTAAGQTLSNTGSAGSGEGHRHNITAVGNHTHDVTFNPPYYALAFIMRTGFFVPPPDPGSPVEVGDAALNADMTIAVGDETTALTTGTAKVSFRMARARQLQGVRASLNEASSSGVVTVDINVGGSSILSTKLTVDQGEKTSVTAAVAAVLSSTTIADDAEVSIDIDGAGTGAKGLKVSLLMRWA